MRPALALIILLGSLVTSVATGDARWFIFGYPLALVIAISSRSFRTYPRRRWRGLDV